MLTKIKPDLYIDLSDIYLVDSSEYQANELLVYIKTHPKIPIILKTPESIYTFKTLLDIYLRTPRDEYIANSENEQSPGQVILEGLDPATES